MRNPLVVVVDWYGPYRGLEEAKKELPYYHNGLYMLIGKRKGKGGHSKGLKYCGISDDLSGRVKGTHSVIKLLDNRTLTIWLGIISCTKKSNALKLAESAHIYFLKLRENTNKKKYPPPQEVTVLNRWWNPDYRTRRKRRVSPDWPDVIDYDGNVTGDEKRWFKNRVATS